MADLITIKTYNFEHEAELAKALLEGEGIFAAVIGGNFNRMNIFQSNAGGGVLLQVLTSDVEHALAVLGLPIPEGHAVDAGWGNCNFCRSTQLEPQVSRFAAALSWLLLGAPVIRPKVSYRCKSCGRTTKEPKALG